MTDIEKQSDSEKDKALEKDPFASLNKLLEENLAFKSLFDSIESIMSDDEDEELEVECVEIGGQDYLVAEQIIVSGTTYLYLVNENNVLDFLIHKIVVEDGEEYVTELESGEEFDLAMAYFQRKWMMMLKDKLKKNNKDSQDDQ